MKLWGMSIGENGAVKNMAQSVQHGLWEIRIELNYSSADALSLLRLGRDAAPYLEYTGA